MYTDDFAEVDAIMAALHQKELEEQEAAEEIAREQRLLKDDPGYDEWLDQLMTRSESV